MTVQRSSDGMAGFHTLIFEFVLAIAVVASGGHRPVVNEAREVQITARME